MTPPVTSRVVPRVVLQDRWDSVMEWSRNGGNATELYVEVTTALSKLVDVVAGYEDAYTETVDGEIVVNDLLLDHVGSILINEIERVGIAR